MSHHQSSETTFLTRSQVAARLGTSLASVRRLEQSGGLHPRLGANAVRLFDPLEVDALRVSRPFRSPRADSSTRSASAPVTSHASGEVAADVFGWLDRGRSPAEIVVGLRLSPAVVRALHADWVELRALDVPAPAASQRLAELERQTADVVARLNDAIVLLNTTTEYAYGITAPTTHSSCVGCQSVGTVGVRATCTVCSWPHVVTNPMMVEGCM